MPTEWYYAAGRSQVGPISTDEVRRLLTDAAKSLGSGLVSGTGMLVGLPGDVSLNISARARYGASTR
jgi:hypothetical protein